MANNTNPTGNSGLSANLLPNFYQTSANKKFLQATIDQLYQPGTVTKTNGYIGHRNSKASKGTDIFVAAADQTRENYQLEPSLVVKDSLGNTTFFKDYIDYINQLNVFGGNTANHARLNKQEFYSWDPHIDWDKFVNFQHYYWLPYGPESITLHGQTVDTHSTYNVAVKTVDNIVKYVFTPDGATLDPALKLYRGQTYTFVINSPANPFSFKTQRTVGTSNRYTAGVSASAVDNGMITFVVPMDAPSLLFYQSETDINLGGVVEIYNVDDLAAYDVTTILGKKNFTLPNGAALSNGMKLSFGGNATPSTYSTGDYYVDGVGTAIKLIPSSILEIVSAYTVNQAVEFDNQPFDKQPFDDATGYATTVDYITINRASRDHNPWSRYNRWFHQDVITASAAFNGNIASLDQTTRAIRPIIEFQADLKLFNLGTVASVDVDLIDTFTTDVLSTIEGARGYSIDGVQLAQDFTILVTADTDSLVRNKIYKVDIVNFSGYDQIHLIEVASPEDGQVVLVRDGVKNKSQMYWYDGVTWKQGQQKLAVNQAPLFDVFDDAGVSYGDNSVYNGSTFSGTTVFSYKQGNGVTDTVLGFPLSYKNVSNIGDIVFNFTLASDTFQYKNNSVVTTKSIDVGYLVSRDYSGNVHYVNGWQTCNAPYTQAAVRIYKDSNKTNNFDIDLFDSIENLDLDSDDIRVYVNDKRVAVDHWSVVTGTQYYQVVFATPVALTDIVTIKVFSDTAINSNGFYEIPVNLQNNPLNNSMGDFTLGEVIDHANSIIDNIYEEDSNGIDNLPSDIARGDINGVTFIGTFPGTSNLRDLGNITQYGTKFVQHSGPASLSMYHITSESNNIIHAIERSRDDYNNFKRNFIATAESLGVDTTPELMVDLIMQKINANRPSTAPYYFSDMVPYGAKVVTELTVDDYRIKTYPLSGVFMLDNLSNKAVGIYLNGTQLVYARDYSFNSFGEVVITATIANGDIIATYEYDNTDGSFVPATPSKLGIWPKFTPEIYTDTTLITPRQMIQCHDGSQILAYGDYRDDVILELEKRIFNNIKVEYDTTIFDISDVIPGYNRTNDYSLSEFNAVLAPNFYKWTGLIGTDFTRQLSYDRANTFTYNYSNNSAPDGSGVPGYWRGVYRWLLDTDRPNICPWEMLGFSIMPTWWTAVYGPAPYTKDNLLLWQDLASGTVREPNMPIVQLEKYVRPFLLAHIPVDEVGNLLSPLQSGLASGIITQNVDNNFVFGDVSPVESAWRRSSHYPFSVLITAMLLTPAKTFGLVLDRSRIIRNLAGQLVYSDTMLRVRPTDIILPSIYTSNTRVQTAGIINYVVDYILNYVFSNNVAAYNAYSSDLNLLAPQLSYRIGAFTNKDKFNFLLDAKTPKSTGSVFVPLEDYNIFLNKSSPVKKLAYSGVIITKLSTGYEVKGYSSSSPYFSYYKANQQGTVVNIGGISASYTTWTPGQRYIAGSIVKNGTTFYSVAATTTPTTKFDASIFKPLAELPVTGGVTAFIRTHWDRTPVVVPYGTLFTKIQDVVDFLLGYGEFLKDQGFVFDTFNSNLKTIANWDTSAKEFLFWTTQNWSSGEDKWSDWIPNQPVSYGSIVRYNGDYFSAIYNIPPSSVFDDTQYTKLDGLSTIGSSVISLSPAADGLTFTTSLSVVDDINNPFNNYEFFKADGTPIASYELNSYRDGNTVTYTPKDSVGIFNASFYLIQNEHVVTINNNTIFNDVIYNPESGYRQERVKISGYVTTGWYGGLDIPGFVFDQASIKDWQPWQDYNMGDIISYQGYYYGANAFTAGTSAFVATDWKQLRNKPTAQILPNWTNLATQFTDFYSLEVDSFDTAQQKVAQHLIGYQKRQYLENIIQDDVSEFKFYQGMIREKGTQNVLNKLFDVLSSENKESLTFYEEWALRVGQYGASGAFENIEFVLDEGLFKNNPQAMLLGNQIDKNVSPFVIQQTPNNVYLKPLGYDSNPFPVTTAETRLLRDAGYVNPADVFVSLGNISEIVSQDITTFENGAYIWCAFENTSWNIYKFTSMDIRVVSVTYDSLNSIITITADKLLKIAAGSYIGLSQVTLLEGFYQVASVTLNTFTINKTVNAFPQTFTQQNQLVVNALISQRADSIDSLDTVVPPQLTPGDLIWTDDSGNGDWATWEYNPVYQQSQVVNSAPVSSLAYGSVVAMNAVSNILAIGTTTGQLITHDKVGISVPWVQRQVVQAPFMALGSVNPLQFIATTVAFSPDGTWMASGSPMVSHVATHIAGPFASGITYNIGDIVTLGNYFYQALVRTTGVAVTNTTNWEQIQYVPASVTGSNSSLIEQGAISIYKKDVNNIYSLVDTIVSPSPAMYEHFGSSLAFSNDTLYVGAVGHNNDTGRVYKFVYKTIPHITTSYNPVGSSAAVIAVTSTVGIRPGMTVVGPGFATGETVVSVLSSTTLMLSGSPNSLPSGNLQFVTLEWSIDYDNIRDGINANERFGKHITTSVDGTVLAISALPSDQTMTGYVLVVKDGATLQTISGTDNTFGQSVAISNDVMYIAVSDDSASVYDIAQRGNVSIYKLTGTAYTKYQDLTDHSPEVDGLFGNKIAFMNGSKTLVVYSHNGDTAIATTLDGTRTSFDKKSTNFKTRNVDSGRIDIYDMYATKWIYSESLPTTTVSDDGYGIGFAVGDNHVLASAPYAIDRGLQSGLVYDYAKQPNVYTWNVARTQLATPDISKIKKAFLYNKSLGTLVKYLDVVDPLQGKIPGIADEEIKFKAFYDPAIYTVGTSELNVNDSASWNTNQVGMLWWDLRTAKFVETRFDDVVFRNNNWNKLVTGASVDIYEWVQTDLLPAEWDSVADTPAGVAIGVSGTSLYGNDVYCLKQRYDNVSRTYTSTYFYWVKNKKIIPAVPGRKISANEVSQLIANPRGQGYSYLAITGTNALTLVNAKQFLADTNVVLSIEYWLIDKTTQNVHSQWKLISNDPIVDLPHTIEQKWFDSLCGVDAAGRQVPDLGLPPKLRYGIENRPRQSMFVSRTEALKEFVERVNKVFKVTRVVEEYDISAFNSYDVPPSTISGLYDTVVATDADIPYIKTGAFSRPSISPAIVDGRIVDIVINSAGSGYLLAPKITVNGGGIDANLVAKINASGQITGVDILNGGEGYPDSTTLSVRDFAALVSSDSQADGNWGIYSYDPVGQLWSRTITQSYDVTKYWNYIDWFGSYTDPVSGNVIFTASQFTAADFSVATLVDLNTIKVSIGETVKVRTVGTGGWSLLYKYADSTSVDWTQSYVTVGIENGTIQLSESLYIFDGTSIGYDANTFDGGFFDIVGSKELRIILNSIKNKILIGTLKQTYLDMFLAAIHYAHSEQVYLDWAFKTSFVRATHNVGALSQPATYPVDNLADFQDYVAEVKPYRTKVREYISNYTSQDPSQNAVTDFDLQPAYERGVIVPIDARVANGMLVSNDTNLSAYPWRFWSDNVGFKVIDLKLISGGAGYTTEPTVQITSNSGSGATARAFVSNGVVSNIVLLTSGSGYLSAPTVTIAGGGATTAARIAPIIGDGVVRSNLISLKFDRVTSKYLITELEATKTVIGSGSLMQFALDWAPDIRIGKSSVTINGIPVLRDLYTLSIVTKVVDGSTQYTGLIEFVTAPAMNATIVVNYIKDISLLNAADRIQYYYDPAVGALGKDLSQLMTGVDYGGVQVSGLGFDLNAGWSELPYGTEGWDVFDETFKDYTVMINDNSINELTLPYIPEAGVMINVYHSTNSIESFVSDGTTTSYRYNIFVNAPVVTFVRSVDTISSASIGDMTINVADTSMLTVGDLVNIPSNNLALVYGTAIASINSLTSVTLTQILFADVTSGTAVEFTNYPQRPTVIVTSTGLVILSNPVEQGVVINVAGPLDPLRIDDPYFGTVDQTNPDAIMATVVADGISSTVTIPNTYTFANGDTFILRESTSDGSVKPQDSEYDTDLTGGDMAYSTATGLAADDIVIDGDGFVTPTSSPATEEVVPGQVVDTLAIKVFDHKPSGGASIKVDSYIVTDTSASYKVTQRPNSQRAVIVKLGNQVLDYGTEYSFDYDTLVVALVNPPAIGDMVSIFSIGFSGSNVLDIDSFTGNGSTVEFITRAAWVPVVTSLVYVNGNAVDVELFKTDASYEFENVIGLRFAQAPLATDLINYIIVSGAQQTFAITTAEIVPTNGAYTYMLTNPIGKSLPNETSMLVRVDQTVLEAPNNSYFTIGGNRLTYTIDNTRFLPNTVDISAFNVYIDNKLLSIGIDYTVDLSGISVKINKSVYKNNTGKRLCISITSDAGYSYNPATHEITFVQAYDNTRRVEVIGSYVHDILGIERSSVNVSSTSALTPDTIDFYNFNAVTGGLLTLDAPVRDDNYVWVTKNGELLVPSVDYKLNDDHITIQLRENPVIADRITMITFTSNILESGGIAYMQFKDMLNRVTYKRLNANKQTRLAQDLHWNDTSILVVDGSTLSVPNPSSNRPGSIEIRGERIEYFALNGNEISRLRRGTYGTGVSDVVLAGSMVQDTGMDETIPYNDTTTTQSIISDGNSNPDGTQTFDLSFIPTSANEIEVFIAGYDNTLEWAANVTYTVGQIVNINSYAYKCVVAHTSSAKFTADSANWKFFIGNIRLKKAPYAVFNIDKAPYSPAGDVEFDADFTVDGISNQLTLANAIPANTRVTIVKKTGKAWDSSVNILDSVDVIGKFVNAVPGIRYTQY